MPCSDHAVLLKAVAQHVCRETACELSAHVRLLPATTRSSTKVVIRSIPIWDAGSQCETKQCLSRTRKRVVAAHYKKDDLLNCWTCSLDISGYHADFHEGHGTIGAWQGRGMGTACYVWIGLYSFTWHCQRKLSGENLICVGSNKETVRLSKIRCGLHHLGKTEVLIKTNHHCSHIRVKVDFIHQQRGHITAHGVWLTLVQKLICAT